MQINYNVVDLRLVTDHVLHLLQFEVSVSNSKHLQLLSLQQMHKHWSPQVALNYSYTKRGGYIPNNLFCKFPLDMYS